MSTFDLISDLKIGHIVRGVRNGLFASTYQGDVTELTLSYEGRVYPIGQILAEP